jgi:hypothetical protein
MEEADTYHSKVTHLSCLKEAQDRVVLNKELKLSDEVI